MRTTKDMDATLKSVPLEKENIKNIIDEILKININDNIEFEIIDIIDIREEDEYGGFKINIMARMDNLKIHLAIELTTGDKITPKEIHYNYNCIFEDKKIPILAYNIETVMAEKFETIVSRGVYNTRMKDYYDIYVLLENKDKFDVSNLKLAIKNTFEKRNTDNTYFYVIEQINEIEESDELKKLWNNYQRQAIYAKDITFEQTIQSIYQLAKLIYAEK